MRRGIPEGVIDNVRGWRDGTEKLDVRALYDTLADRYGHASPTNYAARLLLDLCDAPEQQREGPRNR